MFKTYHISMNKFSFYTFGAHSCLKHEKKHNYITDYY